MSLPPNTSSWQSKYSRGTGVPTNTNGDAVSDMYGGNLTVSKNKIVGSGLKMKTQPKAKVEKKQAPRMLSHTLKVIGVKLPRGMKDIPLDRHITKPEAYKLHAHLTKLKGGSFADSFLSGLVAPFRLAAKINPVLGFGISQAADKLNIPTVSDVINK